MKTMIKKLSKLTFLLLLAGVVITSCNDDEDTVPENKPTGNSETFTLNEISPSGVLGTIKFEELTDKSTRVTISLSGTVGNHPAHIHINTAAQGGGIAIDLTTVDASGASVTDVSAMNDGTAITYAQLIEFNGYVNVHKSSSELAIIIAQGDIGKNALTGNSMDYELFEAAVQGISGKVTFSERENGEALVTIVLAGTSDGGDHPAHVHLNTVAEGGAIAVSLTNVDGGSGVSKTNVSKLDDDSPIMYADWADFNGYVQVHNSSSDLGTIIARGDIGQNKLTGNSEDYDLVEAKESGISGKVTFMERMNGQTLVVLKLVGTPADGDHPAHIHANTVAEGGGVMVALTNVDGASGMSMTNVKELKDGTAISYSEWTDFNGYVQVHKSAAEISIPITYGDIGMNKLTGDSETYTLNAKAFPNISGMAVFAKRKSGKTLVTLKLENTEMDASHPAHIHINTAAEGGGIAIDLKAVDGESGMSWTSINKMNDDTEISYDELIVFNGYINVHNSSGDLGTLVAQGDIGQNGLTGTMKQYTMNEQNASGVSGTVTFYERNNGFTLITLALMGTIDGGDHPSHIHSGSVASPGGVVISLTNVNGKTGMSMTSVSKMNDDTEVTYSDLIGFNGYAQVHNSGADLATILTNGDIGSNVGD